MNLAAISQPEIQARLKFHCVHFHNGVSHPRCFEADRKIKERIGFYDIESSGLKATFGFMITYAIKPLDEKPFVRSVTPHDIRSGVFDKHLCEQFIKDVEQFDRLIGFYSTKFDFPFTRTRCLLHGLDFPAFGKKYQNDVYYSVKSKLSLHSNRLQTVCEFFNIPSKGHKMNPNVWQNAMAGQQSALDFIKLHNLEDVISTEAVWKKIHGFTKGVRNPM
jgi:uncharacterized protein YprB with RNaseH-like and TPR domain